MEQVGGHGGWNSRQKVPVVVAKLSTNRAVRGVLVATGGRLLLGTLMAVLANLWWTWWQQNQLDSAWHNSSNQVAIMRGRDEEER